MYQNVLEKAGLKKGEALIYDILLQNGDSSASAIISQVKYKRGMVYKFLDDLKKQGLISTFKKNKKTFFRPEHPYKLMEKIDANLKETSSQKKSLEAILPNLETQYQLQESKPAILYYEGIEGIKKVFADIYAPKNEVVYGCMDVEKADKAIPGYVAQELVPLRKKNKVFCVAFFNKDKQAIELHKGDATSYRESFLVDKKEYPMPAEVDIYEDKIALLSFAKGKFSGVLISNPDMAQSLKSIFKLASDLKRREG